MRGLGQTPSETSHLDRLRELVDREDYFFHKMELPGGIVTPGWSDPALEKLPYYGLPEDMTGMRVLDVGCAEGFFSFEAERRGAKEVIGIDSFPDGIRRFNICRDAFDSQVSCYLTSVYDLSERAFGTFDLVMFFGVLYHLRNPILALEKIFSVCSGSVLIQTANVEREEMGDASYAEFHPFGVESGPPEDRQLDPTVFWMPNSACVRDMLRHVGFTNASAETTFVYEGSTPVGTVGCVGRGEVPNPQPGAPPDQMKAPWC